MSTPETDAFLIEGGNFSYAGLADHARRLERQRAALAEMLARTVDCLHDCRLRDEAHAMLAELDESNQRKEVK